MVRASTSRPESWNVGFATTFSDCVVVLVRGTAVGRVDIVDQPLVQRPGVHPPFPVVDDRVAEAVDLGLHVGHPRRTPRVPRGLQTLGGRFGKEGVDGRLQLFGAGQAVAIGGGGDIGIGGQDVADFGGLSGGGDARQGEGAERDAEHGDSFGRCATRSARRLLFHSVFGGGRRDAPPREVSLLIRSDMSNPIILVGFGTARACRRMAEARRDVAPAVQPATRRDGATSGA